ncbi:MAG TPA: FAD-binding and (Fe-S)-binding domain-containing protein, partial [Thermoanaerobaculia bacterium]|nr:FAD-binding and (Fe-S)-binding domain-containing protein [Thermoanaerobaculia bacterium]
MSGPPPFKAPSPELLAGLASIVGSGQVKARPIDRIAWASDASFYRLVPEAVVHARNAAEVRALFALSRERKLPLTFRSAGTSLSGQAITDGVLVEVARGFRGLSVEEDGKKIRLQPGVIGAHANRALLPWGRKIGPDPASIATCTVGGIVSNNASGMCCGVAQNAYHTLDSLTFLLPSGTLVDTGSAGADDLFREKEPELWQGLLDLRARLEGNTLLAARIRAKYRMKNTTGYSLNAFLDFERPVEIFRHLLVGSEGTLAFVAEVVLDTVPDLPVKYTGLLLFPGLHAACAAVAPLRDAGAKALEVMDRAALRSVESEPGVPPSLRTLPPGAAGLLAEFQAKGEGERPELETAAQAAVAGLSLLVPARFTHDAGAQAQLWKVRQGMFPSVGAVRKSGTTVIIEDVAFPLDRLADAAVALNGLFSKHGYADGIVFGHARDGNLHFVLTQSFRDPKAVAQYARFMDDVVNLVVRTYDGALKAEHGTGRNMAPFVETEWGPEAWAVMKRLKELADPDGLLNPGVIVNADAAAHLRNLKPLPTVEEEVDRCIECGFCEPSCPSRELTLTPRQRIAVRREMARLDEGGADPALRDALDADFPYDALDTCAADGLCAIACPVKIDTGALTKRFRAARHSRTAHWIATAVARRLGLVEPALRAGLRAGHVLQSLFGARAMVAITKGVRALSDGAFPLWSAEMPRAAKATIPRTVAAEAEAVYFPSCLSRTMGALPGEPSEMSPVEALVEVAARAGVPVFVPVDAAGTCCGVPFSSKGYRVAHAVAVNRAVERLFRWSDGGRLPVVVDTSPCTYGLLQAREALTEENRTKLDAMTILDAVEFVHDALLPKLAVTRREPSAVLHPVCSLTKMGLAPKLRAIAEACSEKTVVPLDAGCCGFAGDRGFLVPELTASAT